MPTRQDIRNADNITLDCWAAELIMKWERCEHQPPEQLEIPLQFRTVWYVEPMVTRDDYYIRHVGGCGLKQGPVDPQFFSPTAWIDDANILANRVITTNKNMDIGAQHHDGKVEYDCSFGQEDSVKEGPTCVYDASLAVAITKSALLSVIGSLPPEAS